MGGMDMGRVLGMDGQLVGSPAADCGGLMFSSPSLPSGGEANGSRRGVVRSAFLEQGRASAPEEHDWRRSKMARATTEPMMTPPAPTVVSPSTSSSAAASAASLLRSNSQLSLFPDGQQMLSFSTPKADSLMLCNDGSLAYYHPSSSSFASSAAATYGRNTGLSLGSLNANVHGVLAGVRGAFTPSQWMELEHQAMIYKCIDANVPIPPSLLISIKKSLNPSGYGGYAAGSLRAGAFGWGSFQLGFSGSTDPEPGRCRRTDGKKWRCSRDAVVDQKYCERHLNRGRHRSRKPVEGQAGHAKVMTTIASLPATSTVSGNGSPHNPAITQQKKSLQPGSTDSSANQFNGISVNKDSMNGSQSLSLSNCMKRGFEGANFSLTKQHNPFEDSSSSAEFGLLPSDSLLNPPRSSYLDSRSIDPSALNDQEQQPNLLHPFIDNWPKVQTDRSTCNWPEVEQTELSISTPMTCSGFSASPSHQKLNLFPLKQSQDLDLIQTGLGVGSVINDGSQRQASWIPISWGTSMGGPLGEVLNNANSTTDGHNKNSYGLNLMFHGWESSSSLDSSPTGVLQKTTFGSLSSSAGSSPRTDNYRSHETMGGLNDDLLGSAFANLASVPSL